MNRSKRKGTSAETAVVEYMRKCGWENVERRALQGKADKGDIAGTPVVIEVKNCAEMQLSQWLKEAAVEADNAGLDVGVVWHKKRGTTNPGEWYVTMSGNSFIELLSAYAEERNRMP